MVRTQLYLDDEIHAHLQRLARRQGRTLSELVRDALVRVYGGADPEKRLRTLKAIEGLWKERDDIGESAVYVRALRRDTRRRRKPSV
jgi:hypothetical protein